MEVKGRVQIENFNFCFPEQEKPFLKDINISIEPGEFVAIVGPSSCGKSTLGLCLTGIYPHVLEGTTTGSIMIGGLDVASAPTSQITTKIGIVFQDPDSQFCNLLVEEEVAFGPENLLTDREIVKQRIEKYLSFVNLKGFEKRRITELSGGQKQRVAIASVLAMEPEILVLDQPTANVDPSGKEDIFETLYKLNQETGKTLILIEHQIDELVRYVDKLIVMEDGAVLYQGNPREILATHSEELEEKTGLWIPEVSRAGRFLAQRNMTGERFPIVVEELAQIISENAQGLLDAPKRSSKPLRHKEAEDVITATDVHFSYPSKPDVLNGVSFSIKKGSIAALMGENGSGKTTISKMLIGLLKPGCGKIIVDGLDVGKTTLNEICKRVGYVFQYPEHQFVTDTVVAEVAYGLKRFSMQESEKQRIVKETIAITELSGLEQRHPFTLSMGEKRRLSIATMLVQNPDILILDEPSAGLDYKNCDHMMQVLHKLNEQGVTIIMISHTTYLVARYSEQVLVMDAGEIVFDGTPVELFRRLEHIHTRAIEKPEILKAVEFAEAKTRLDLPSFLVADEIRTEPGEDDRNG